MFRSGSGEIKSREDWISRFCMEFDMLPDQAENYFLALVDTKTLIEI